MKQTELLHQLGVLAAQLMKVRKENEKSCRVAEVLRGIPHVQEWNGSLGESYSALEVEATAPSGEIFNLAGEFEFGSNYAGSQTRRGVFGSEELRSLADQPCIVQLAYLIQNHGKPLKVKAKFRDLNDWPDSELRDEKWEVEFDFP